MDVNNDIDTTGIQPIPFKFDDETPEVQQWERDFLMTWHGVVATPQEADVKLGRGTGSNLHSGNQGYLEEVKRMLRDDIEANGGVYEWNEIYGIRIYNYVTEVMGGRFVKKITKKIIQAENLPECLEGTWFVLEYTDVREKIQQVFRGSKTT